MLDTLLTYWLPHHQVGMVFVRCGNNGISHSPLEYVAPEDVAAVTVALYKYLEKELI